LGLEENGRKDVLPLKFVSNLKDSVWLKLCSILIVLFSLIPTPSFGIADQAKAKTPSSVEYFYPFAKNLSEIRIHTAATDTEGCVYLAGSIPDTPRISFFPIGGAIPGFSKEYNGGSSDGFVMKLDPSGTKLLFSTFIGGSDFDEIASIHVNDSGMVYLAGHTHSRPEDGFPIGGDIPGLQRTSPGMIDGFLMILDPSGTKVLYSSYIGGGSSEDIEGLALDAEGNIYLSGKTLSTEKDAFPIGGSIPGYDSTFNGELYDIVGEPAFDAFVMKFDPTGMKVLYSTYLGGKGYNWTNGLKVDSLGRAHVTGSLGKLNTPDSSSEGVSIAYQQIWEHDYEKEEHTNYLLLDPTGSKVIFSALLPYETFINTVNDHLLICGVSGQDILADFRITEETTGFLHEHHGRNDIYTVILDDSQRKVLAATYLGGGSLSINQVTLDSKGQVYILGHTYQVSYLGWESDDLKVTDSYYPTTQIGFIVKLDPTLETILYAGHFKSSNEYPNYPRLAVDNHESVYISGLIKPGSSLGEHAYVMKVNTQKSSELEIETQGTTEITTNTDNEVVLDTPKQGNEATKKERVSSTTIVWVIGIFGLFLLISALILFAKSSFSRRS